MNRTIDYLIIAAILGMWALMTFKGAYITIEPEEPDASYVETSWWGLHQERHTIRWMESAEYDRVGWMIRGRDGTWTPMLFDEFGDDGPPSGIF